MARAPIVLIVSEHEWASRSLDTVLGHRGYAVLRAYTGELALERASASNPDAVFIEHNLPDMSGADLCRELLASDAVSPAAPFIVMTSGPITPEERIDVLRAGAWEVLALPVDAEELVLRLERYVRAKLEADRAQDRTLLDPDTGLYTRAGVLQRARELAAAAARYGRPIACIVVEMAASEGEPRGDREIEADIATLLRSSTRRSDILGQLGPHQYAVLTPDTPEQGARVAAERLRRSTGPPAGAGAPGTARTAVFSISDLDIGGLDPEQFVRRAAEALGADPDTLLN